MITIKIKTVIQGFGEIANQASGTGTGLNTPVKTDTTDMTTSGTVSGFPVACPGTCLSQVGYSTPSDEDPTKIELGAIPTAAPALVSGQVVDTSGRGISRTLVTLQNAASGQSRSVMTNTFGRFAFNGVETGEFYVISVINKRYRFVNSSFAFNLNENLTSIVFTEASSRFGGPTGVSKSR